MKKSYPKPVLRLIIYSVLFLFGNIAFSQTVLTYNATTPGPGTWICPPGVTTVQVETWGGGGGGGFAKSGNGACGGGGGGGGYTTANIAVTPGTTYYYTVGAGGSGGIPGANVVAIAGGMSCFSTGATCTGVLSSANGGGLGNQGVLVPTPGAAGAGGIGGTFNGGNGSIGVNTNNAAGGGGGGGGGASTTQPGGNAALKVGGTGGAVGGGNGANGTSGANGTAGTAIGGGGSGGHRTTAGGNARGGNGAGGQVRLTFTLLPCPTPSQANTFVLGTPTSTSLPASFSGTASNYLVVSSLTNTPPSQPVNGVTYSAANIATLGAGFTFVQSSTANTIAETGLVGNTRYYYFIYAFNDGICLGGPLYNTAGPLTGNGVTCSAMPNSVTTSGVGTTAFTLNWTAPSGGTEAAITYTVQVTTNAAYTANIAGSPFTLAAPTSTLSFTGLTVGATYYYRILASNGCSSSYVTGTVTLSTGTYCTSTSTGTFAYINNFTTTGGISNINNTTVLSTGGYGDYSASLSASQLAGQPINFSSSYTGGTHGFGIWIDWNNDNDFADAGENVYLSGSYNNSDSSSFTIPTGTPAGSHRMRIRANYNSTTPAACGAITNGETEDYTFVVAAPLPCPTFPTSLSTTALSATTATLNWGAPAPAPANGYEYFVSTSPTTPTAAAIPSGSVGAGITSANITGLLANTTYYFWIRSNCNGVDKGFWVGYGTFYTAFCIAGSTNTVSFIKSFSTTGGITNITNNNSGLSAGGYGNFTAMSASQQPYSSVNFSTNFNGDDFGFNIWIDFNDDLDFNDSGEKVYGSGAYVFGTTGSFGIPGSAPVGPHRMRIRGDYFSTNPTACGSITDGETEDYTFTVVALACGDNPANLPATGITLTTATINWTAPASPPANGYQYIYSTSGTIPGYATAPTATSLTTNASLTGLASGTTYTVWVRSDCGGYYGVWIGPLTFTTTVAPPVTTNAIICQGTAGSISGTASCTAQTNLGNTISGSWDATSDPRAVRPLIFISNSPNCQFDTGGLTSNYTALNFTVSVTGSYSFTMPNVTAYDAMGYIVIPPFIPGNCASGTWIVGDDDSGATLFEPLMTATLTMGTIYTLYTTLYSGSDIALTNSYQWNVTGPGNILGLTAGALQWYTAASGGSPIATGSSFNPIGIPGSGLSNTNTPGTTVYYAACSGSPSIRTATNYTITGPTSLLSGSGSICASAGTTMTVNFTGTAPWTFTYSDGVTPVTVTTSLNPYTFTVTPTVPTTYTITALNDVNCTAVAANRTGNGTVSAKTWNGSASANWNNAANWTPASVPTASDCVVVPNMGAGNTPLISGASYAAYAYNLTILNGGILQINSTNSITVTDVVAVNTGGQFLIKDSASLIQVNNVANTGIINMERITKPMYRYDYTYWGSPLTLASNFTLGGISPNTQPDKYYSWIPFVGSSFGTWQQESAATIMDPRKGYIIRAPQTYSTSPSVKVAYTANFIGVPNNGTITCPIGFGTMGGPTYNDRYNLLGNPYPSAVSAASFLNLPGNASVIDGTIYFWTHNSPILAANPDPFYNDFIYNYSASDYASWNKIGGVGTAATSLPAGSPAPNGFIAAGQSFFVRSLTNGNALFNNSMRSAAHSNSQFFRLTDSANPPVANDDEDMEKHRIWLNLINNSGSFCQILVGYAAGATSGFDRGYDGLRFDYENSNTFYSFVNDDVLVIQGRPLPFEETDQVPLGYISLGAAEFSIRIDHVDGLFENQDIYIEDKLLNVIHDLRAAPYNFTSAPGRFDDRFVLRYTNSVLSNNQFDSDNLTAFINDRKFHASATENIVNIDIYELNGKLVTTYKPALRMKTFEDNFLFAQGIYFAKIKLENGMMVTQKLLNR